MAETVASGKARPLADGDRVLILFGTDQFRVDRRRGVIHFDGIGRIRCPEVGGMKRTAA
jgi:hypothetical protein